MNVGSVLIVLVLLSTGALSFLTLVGMGVQFVIGACLGSAAVAALVFAWVKSSWAQRIGAK